MKTISESETHADYIGMYILYAQLTLCTMIKPNDVVHCMHVGYQRFEISQCFGLSVRRDMLYYVRSTFLVSLQFNYSV